MQSFREQSNYHGTPPTYPPESHGASRLEEFSPRQQTQVFPSGYGGRRSGTTTPNTVTPGENSNLQNYHAYRKESGDFYYLGNKEAGTAGVQTTQRRLTGPVQSYGPPQGNSSASSTGYSTHYGREGHHSQFAGQHSSPTSLSQYSQDFPGSFSPGSGQYSSHVSSQQLRNQLYQSHQSLSQAGTSPAPTGASHLQQIQRSANLNSPSGYPLRIGQFGQHYQSSPGSSSSSYPSQRFGQSGTNYEAYSPGGTSSPYENHMSGSYGTQQAYSSYASQHLKTFEAAKVSQGGSQGPQQNPSLLMQFSNSSKLLTQNQTGQYNQSEVPVRSPMQFQQNFSPISNPSPAASVVQSPSCSSTPSPLMTGGENNQCGQGNVPLPSRNRVMPVMPQLSPNTQNTSFKGYGVEGSHEKRLADPCLSSLSALSSQVANLPNTVQHMLLSDALTPHKKGRKRTSRKTDSCANSETSSQAEEQLKSPTAESLDGSCSSSSGDPIERVRQLSGQSTSSEAGYKGPPSEKPASPVHTWQNEPSGKTAVQDIDIVPEPAETYHEISKPNEKAVGVIVSTETVTNRSEKVVDETQTVISNDDDDEEEEEEDEDDPSPEPELPETTKEEDTKTSPNAQNGEPNTVEASSATVGSVPSTETDTSPVGAGFGFKEAPSTPRNPSSLPQPPKNSDPGTLGGHNERKTGRNEKYPSLLQEVLQGHHQQERRYVRNAQEQPTSIESPDVPLRPNVLMSQVNDQPSRSMLGKTLESSHWGQWDRKPPIEVKQINLADYPNPRKFEGDPPAPCHEPSSGPSERRSVICDISPLRQLVRDPATSHHVASSQERSQDSRAGQSVILPSGVLSLEKSNSQSGVAKSEDLDSPKMMRKRTAEPCIPYRSKESPRGNASPRSMTFDSGQEYSSHGRSTNPKRGGGRVGSRGRPPAHSQDHSDKLKMASSPGRSRGSTDIHHMTPTMSLSERASREALYSAFFQNADNAALAYHSNSRSSSYGEPHPSFTSSLHFKRQMYQQEEYKEWLGSSAQAILSSQHRQDLQRKSPRQESFHVRSPGRSDNEGLAYSQAGSYHDPSSIDFSRQMRISECTSSALTAGDLKRNSQKTPPGDLAGWHLGRQCSPAKKSMSSASANQKSFGPIRDPEMHGPRPIESTELSKSGCNAHRPSGPEEGSHHNPLIMRRKVRSFISPIPSKRQVPDDKVRPVIAPSKDGSDRTMASHIRSPRGHENEHLTEEQSKPIPEQRSPTAVTLSSPTKTKILPPRKGRGLKLEAIVQKITSPNVRRSTAPSSSESVVEPVTLDDILSLKGRPPETVEETSGRTMDVVPDNSKNDCIKIQNLSPKAFEAWSAKEEKQIKKEMDEQFIETKDLLQPGPLIQHAANHHLEIRGNSPAPQQKGPMPQPQVCEIADKEKVVTAPCPTPPKQTIIPPKGYFPSGKKKGRPIGSVNKQKKQQQLQQQQQQKSVQQQQKSVQQQSVQQQVQDQQLILPPVVVSLEPLTLPKQTSLVLEPAIEAEPKPKRRRRERRKQPGTTRRRRGKQVAPIVAPVEPEIKLKYASQTLDKTETKPKSFFPYIHVENKEEIGLSCVIINAEEEEQRWRNVTSVRKDQRSTSPQPSERKALPVSSFMVSGPPVTESTTVGHLVCCFCGKWANYKNLGDLFGPFYTQEYASTLSKNPPPKKSSETPKKVKVRHKDGLDGSKSDSDEEEEEPEPEQAREQRSLSAHPRYKRRNRSGDCTSSRHAVPSRRMTADPNELASLDSSGSVTADGVPEQGFQIPQLPLDSNEFWMHEACVLWANGVYFVCGRLYGLQEAWDVAREMVSNL